MEIGLGPSAPQPRLKAQAAPLSDVSLAGRRRWHTLAFAVIALWIFIGIGYVIARQFGAPVIWWELIHPFTIGALTTAIIVYSTHFAEALTRTATQNYRAVAARVALVQVGLLFLLIDRAGYDWGPLADAASLLIIASLAWHIWAIARALRGSLAGSFAVTVPFYIAAAAFMIVAVVCAVLAGRGVGNYSSLIAAHQRAAVWGFALLTIVGTVVTLLPTLSNTKISPTARARCLRALTVHCSGLSAAVVCYALGLPLPAGIAQLLTVLASALVIASVVSGVLGGAPQVTAASASVLAGVFWMVALNAADAASVLAGAFPRAVTLVLMPAFVGGGLLQLVTGVLTHLLPTLRGGGREAVYEGRRRGTFAAPARVVLVNLGALITLTGPALAGIIMMGLGLIGHVAAICWSLKVRKSA